MWERLRGTAACWESVGAVGWWGTWRGLLWGEKAADGQKEKDEMALVNSAAGPDYRQPVIPTRAWPSPKLCV